MSDPAIEGQEGPDGQAHQPASAPKPNGDSQGNADPATGAPHKRRRRGSRGGRTRNRSRATDVSTETADAGEELPDRPIEGRPQSVEAAERALVRKPQIGDSRPAPAEERQPAAKGGDSQSPSAKRRRRRGGRG